MMAKTKIQNQPKQKTKFNPIELGRKAYAKFRESRVYKAIRGLPYDRKEIEARGYVVSDMMELVDTAEGALCTKTEYNKGAFNTYRRLFWDGKLDEADELRALHKDDPTIQVNHPHYVGGLATMKQKMDEIEARARGRTGRKKSTKKSGTKKAGSKKTLKAKSMTK